MDQDLYSLYSFEPYEADENLCYFLGKPSKEQIRKALEDRFIRNEGMVNDLFDGKSFYIRYRSFSIEQLEYQIGQG